MQYKIKHSFYSPDGQYSGEAGRTIDQELYEKAVSWGLSDRVEVVGVIPDSFLTDEQLDQKLAELLQLKEQRNAAKDSETLDENENSEPQKKSRKS